MTQKSKHENKPQRLAKGVSKDQKNARHERGRKNSTRPQSRRDTGRAVANPRNLSPLARLVQSLGNGRHTVSNGRHVRSHFAGRSRNHDGYRYLGGFAGTSVCPLDEFGCQTRRRGNGADECMACLTVSVVKFHLINSDWMKIEAMNLHQDLFKVRVFNQNHKVTKLNTLVFITEGEGAEKLEKSWDKVTVDTPKIQNRLKARSIKNEVAARHGFEP